MNYKNIISRKISSSYLCIIFFALIFINCSRLPKEQLSPFDSDIVDFDKVNDSLCIHIVNPLHCPLRFAATTTDSLLLDKMKMYFPTTVSSMKDTLLTFWTDKSIDELQLEVSVHLGDPRDSIIKKAVHLPFMRGEKYKILQGHNGSFSHTSDYSKYALDFNMSVGDTICATADGYVVGVIEDYSEGGRTKKWKNYSNYIVLFHPEMNLYSLYGHLVYKGSFVNVGDTIKTDQPIGMSGNTGYSDVEHLHFNMLKANEFDLQSVPIDFVEGYRGVDLKRGSWVEK